MKRLHAVWCYRQLFNNKAKSFRELKGSDDRPHSLDPPAIYPSKPKLKGYS